MILPKT